MFLFDTMAFTDGELELTNDSELIDKQKLLSGMILIQWKEQVSPGWIKSLILVYLS